MAMRKLDVMGFRCPRPMLKVVQEMTHLATGDILEVKGDCPTFEQDLRNWCKRMDKTVLAVVQEGDALTATIRF